MQKLATRETRILEQYAKTHQKDLDDLISQRLIGKPICKIIGSKGFYKYDFLVNEDVLSPRPDTECLVEAAIEFAQKSNAQNILDLGLGSGCILLSILKDIEQLQGTGVDISTKALSIAKQNAHNLEVANRTTFINASWFDLPTLPRFDIITANPPYINSETIPSLDKEVKDFDPLLALDGGVDGLRDYRQIAQVAQNLLQQDGKIFLEVGYNQAADVIDIFRQNCYKHCATIKDLSHINRCVVFSLV